MAWNVDLTSNLSKEYFLKEAKTRWLRPSEIIEILHNYQRFNLIQDPPSKPPSGSLFLIDRKVHRYFRKDGHCWKKKKGGRNVQEAHEKLKIGNVDVVHCYYARSEDNEAFQRRIYWALDEQVENIVLVHYRDLNEGSRILLETDPTTFTQGIINNATVCSSHLLPTFETQASYASTPSTSVCHGQMLSEFEDADSGDKVSADSSSYICHSANGRIENNNAGCSGSIPHPHSSGLINTSSRHPLCNFSPYHSDLENLILSEDHQPMCRESQTLGSIGGSCFRSNTCLPMLTENIISNKKNFDEHGRNIFDGRLDCFDSLTRKTTDSFLNGCAEAIFGDHCEFSLPNAHPQSFMADEAEKEVEVGNATALVNPAGKHMMNDSNHAYQVSHERHFDAAPHFHDECGSRVNIATMDQPLDYETEVPYDPANSLESDTRPSEHGELNKLDSFGRWMNKEIGKDCDQTLMSSVSGSYWNDLDTQSGDEEVSNLSRHVHLDIPLGPSISQDQLFSILDFSPEWAYSGVETKVLITGNFLGGIEPASRKWCCMFGEYEVAAEVLTTKVIRCQAPAHAPGRVPFYITCSNRLACSEVREFEYCKNVPGETSALKSVPEDEIYFQVRFTKLLFLGMDRKGLACSSSSCPKCNLKKDLFAMLIDDEAKWEKIEKDFEALQGSNRIPKEILIQNMLKEKLFEWLVCKTHEGGKEPEAWDEEGLGVIHLASALGYQWALRPIVTAGISPSFRDACGRTGLHWAAYYGREEAVLALVELDADPGAVEDPTSEFPDGRTAADLAGMRGHKGIAGYLAELDLTRHVSKLAIKETVVETASAKQDTETVQGQIIDDDKGEKETLQQSLAAVRNSALAAALIQSALSSQLNNPENADIQDEMLRLSSLNNKGDRLNHFNDYLHTAAIRNQKIHGFRRHKGSLKIHNHFKKIQAHVRGHQVHMQYKKILWSVSIMEKAILRWRRKRSGLRDFQVKNATGAHEQEEAERTNEYQFLHLGRRQKMAATVKALERVQSMARNPEARLQYMSLVANFQKLKLAKEGNLSGSSSSFRRGEEEG